MLCSRLIRESSQMAKNRFPPPPFCRQQINVALRENALIQELRQQSKSEATEEDTTDGDDRGGDGESAAVGSRGARSATARSAAASAVAGLLRGDGAGLGAGLLGPLGGGARSGGRGGLRVRGRVGEDAVDGVDDAVLDDDVGLEDLGGGRARGDEGAGRVGGEGEGLTAGRGGVGFGEERRVESGALQRRRRSARKHGAGQGRERTLTMWFKRTAWMVDWLAPPRA